MVRERQTRAVQEFENGAHVTVPENWLNGIVELTLIAKDTPDIFNKITADSELTVTLQSGVELHGCVTECTIEDYPDGAMEYELLCVRSDESVSPEQVDQLHEQASWPDEVTATDVTHFGVIVSREENEPWDEENLTVRYYTGEVAEEVGDEEPVIGIEYTVTESLDELNHASNDESGQLSEEEEDWSREDIRDRILNIVTKYDEVVIKDELLYEEMKIEGVERKEVDMALSELKSEDELYETESGRLNKVGESREQTESSEVTLQAGQEEQGPKEIVMGIISDLYAEDGSGAQESVVVAHAVENGLSEPAAKRNVQRLKNTGEIYEVEDGELRIT